MSDQGPISSSALKSAEGREGLARPEIQFTEAHWLGDARCSFGSHPQLTHFDDFMGVLCRSARRTSRPSIARRSYRIWI